MSNNNLNPSQLPILFLRPGEIHVATTPTEIRTILGSCISICAYDFRMKIAGMNHYLLPVPEHLDKINQHNHNKNDYGIFAIPELFRAMKEKGCQKKDLLLKVLGGSKADTSENSQTYQVGKENVEIAKSILKKFGFSADQWEIGGNNGRLVRFLSNSGELFFRYIKKQHSTLSTQTISTQNPLERKKIKVMIIDDSKPVLMILRKMIDNSPLMQVVAMAQDPIEAMKIQKKIRPDVITLDLNMPRMDGLTYLKQYMISDPIPTVIVTDYNLNDSRPMFTALEYGAFDYIKKPSFTDVQTSNSDFHEKIISAFQNGKNIKNSKNRFHNNSTVSPIDLSDQQVNAHIWSIGASTGGTEAIKSVLLGFPSKIPPTLIVQHMPPVFTTAFAERLNEICPFEVKEANDDELLKENTVYVAPGGHHMKVVEDGNKIKIKITEDPLVNRFRPSVDYLFNSLQYIKNRKIVAALLTGMGDDGARGLLNLRQLGASTIAQDETTCTVFGMPKVAIELGGALYVERLNEIANRMILLVKRSG
ncbi:MAG: chemotaxis-specific protein-glutamate methyltransferase CheB [Oligoflexia bacterium]|nr:chemotaxis-specific protein-glutamate methyltransferase CheB [Oligoflexia bacterium]